jgi:hypothetical protein
MQLGARVASLALAAALAAGCCGAAARGTPCIDPAPRDGGVAHVVSPALECHSHLCLVTPRDEGETAMCTVECANDDDCRGVDLDCRSGAVCASLPPYPRSVCVCR